MKTSIMTLCTALTFPLAPQALGQSSFLLSNEYGVLAPVSDSGGVPLEGTNYLVELWGGATTDSLTPAITYFSRQRVIISFLTGPVAGYFVDTYAGRGSIDDLCIFAVPGRGWAWLQVRAWDARLGGTYEQVVALGFGGYGESPLFYAQGGAPGSTLPDVPAPLSGLQSFSLLPVVPEPSAGLILLLGLPLLLRHFRRPP